MKKFLLIFLLTTSTSVFAADWGYVNQNSYQKYRRPAYQQPRCQSQSQQPRYQRQYQQPGYQRQYQQSTQPTQRYSIENQSNYSNYETTPAQKSHSSKRFYITPRVGGSYVNFLNEKGLDGGFGFMTNIAAGMYFNQFRTDVEVGYHFEREMGNSSIDFNQIDFLANGYYDFKNSTSFTPFIGAGIGFAHTKLSVDLAKLGEVSASETNLSVALSGGINYALNDVISFEGMGRGKYIFCNGDLLDLELLAGVRFSF